MARTIVVSDLHIDTWTDRKIGNTGKSKKEHFFDLLDWCRQAGVREFVINGDLMEFPPYAGQFSFPEGPSIARDVVERLVKFGASIPVTYVYGNHDIGVSGFRSLGQNNIASLKNINFCYPDYVIDDYPGSTILIEHGHFCDPVILLYLRDLANRTYRESRFEEFHWAMQRRMPEKPKLMSFPGVLDPVTPEPGENVYYAAKYGQKPLPHTGLWLRIKSLVQRMGSSAIAKPTMEHWWSAALERMDDYMNSKQDNGLTLKPRLYQMFGHTHRADPRDPVWRGSIQFIYINTGTWTEEVNQGWYVDIDDQGKVWLQDWINESSESRMI